jgi:Ca2+-binding RTX toxin-like protein
MALIAPIRGGVTRYGDTSGTLLGNSVGGNQTITGTLFNDVLYGDADTLRDYARGGDDTLNSGSGNDFVYGDAQSMLGYAQGGHDYLDGGAGSDYMVGDADFMYGHTVGGQDVIHGGNGNDAYLFGDAHTMRDFAVGAQTSSPAIGAAIRSLAMPITCSATRSAATTICSKACPAT